MSSATAQIYLTLTLIPCLIVIWKDLSKMIIPNLVSIVMVVIFAITAPFLLEWQDILRQLGFAVVLFAVLLGFYMLGVVSAGDVKFASAMILFVDLGDATFFFRNLGLIALAGLLAHTVIKRTPPLRNLAPEWKSWTVEGVFPYGLALASSLIFYLLTRVL